MGDSTNKRCPLLKHQDSTKQKHGKQKLTKPWTHLKFHSQKNCNSQLKHRKSPQCKDNITHLILYAMSPIFKMAFGSSFIWFFPSQFSQYTLYWRNGSNACTFIALLLVKFYFFDKSALSLSQHTSLLLKWKSLFINCISLENHTYDSVILGIGRYFSVQEATPFLTPITSNVQLDSFDLSMLNENPVVPQSSLAF